MGFVCLHPLVSTAVCLICLLCGAKPGLLEAAQLPYVTLQGAVVLPVSFVALTVGPGYIPAAEVSLLLLLETVLGPVWVWLVLDEEPSPTALWAGVGLVLVLVVHSILGWREGESAAPDKCAQAQKQAENVPAQC